MTADFFIPFHLPMVIPEDDSRNIAYRINDCSDDFSDWRMSVIHQLYETARVKAIRLNEGVYQTIEPLGVLPLQRKLFPFSISLN